MKALISSIEPVETGYRVAQVEQDANVFAVADGLFWVDCADDVLQDLFWYDPLDKAIKAITQPEVQAVGGQPTIDGAEIL